ncbi:BREX-3 system phosphatase PglZ [Risungbinella massiliensis]|uniref:BREX-3 system phosphatase PglZ n=1 Tax=Risungbinella massiliensis TaxID=1329796 RepID=UPI0005CC80ED|nr:BREX-3 system phosphatase PglZ [Risungbinella massiliensis]
MINWRDEILKHFVEPIPSLLIVSDPDHLLLEKKILDQLLERKLEILEYKDPIRFRYLFESTFRDRLNNGSVTLIVHVEDESVQHLPYDLLQIGEIVELRLSNLFPKMSLSVIKQLTFEQLDALFTVYGQYQGSISVTDTCDFLLRKFFKGSGYQEIETKEDLMEFLFKKHYEEIIYPNSIVNFVVEQLQKKASLAPFPLKELVSSASYFYFYVQKEWKQLVQSTSANPQLAREIGINSGDPYTYFHLPSVKAVLDNLFMEGKLFKLTGVPSPSLPKWMRVGIQTDIGFEQKEQLTHFTKKLEAHLQEEITYKNWIKIAQTYGEWKHVFLSLGSSLDDELVTQLKQLEIQVDHRFQQWMCSDFHSIVRLPFLPNPVMVHHIPHYLQMKKKKEKIALIVLDGMSFVQWGQIKQVLSQTFHLEERGVFAWVPTITSVSRQAIFAGEPPFYFPDSIHTTHKEEQKWKSFWENQQISRMHITYEKGLGQGRYDRNRIRALEKPNTRIAGLVVDTIDQFSHGTIQGLQGIQEEISLWLRNRYLVQLIADLLAADFDVYIASDHGNKESVGIGKVLEGVLAETRGERVRIYQEESLRNRAAENYPSIRWNDVALPKNRHVLLAKSGQAFIIKDQVVVSHGGISLEEVVVPFVRVAPKADI